MPRTFYCITPAIDPETGVELGAYSHDWTVESSPLPLTHEYLFVQCPDHDGDVNSEGPDHVPGLFYGTPLPR